MRRGWLTQTCAGVKKTPKALQLLLDSGEFDDALHRTPDGVLRDFRFRVLSRSLFSGPLPTAAGPSN